jgi:hypothetical protein
MATKTVTKKAKVKVEEEQWYIPLETKVKILSRGHFPDTMIAQLDDGTKIEVDQVYLAKLH